MKRAGVLRLPLFEAPYVLPDSLRDVEGKFSFDPASIEPFMQRKGGLGAGDNVFRSAWIMPYTYGLNAYSGPDAPNNVFFDGDNTVEMGSEWDAVMAKFRFGYGNSYYKGGAEGEVWNGNPASARTPWYPVNMGDGIESHYIVAANFPLYNFPAYMDLLSPDGRMLRVPMRVNGIQPKTGLLYCTADSYNFCKMGSNLGAVFDSPDDEAWIAAWGETFSVIFALWNVGDFLLILNGSGLYMNSRGMVLTPANGQPIRYIDYSGSYAGPANFDPSNGAYAHFAVLPEAIHLDDDPELEATLSDVAGGYYFLGQGGAMFPNQAFTPVLFDPVTQQYWLVQFIPKTLNAEIAIASPNFISMKYSAAGYMVMTNSGDFRTAGMVFHTDALSVDYPPITLPTVQPLQLPCFNPCVPNLVYGD